MIRVRAFENQVFVAYVGLCGSDGRFAYAGRSHVAAPDGRTLARAGLDETLLTATLDPAAEADSRARNPYLADVARGAGSLDPG
jgi:predicted amidohydrolase